MGKRQLIVFFIALILFSILSVLYSTQAIADLRMFYQDPSDALGAEFILRPQAVDVTTANANQTDLLAAQQVVERRLDSLYLAGTYKVVTQGDQLVVELPRTENIPYVASVISSVGEVEFIDGGLESPPVGQAVQTAAQANPHQNIYQTLFTGQEVEAAELPDSATGQIFYRLTLQPAATDRLNTFIQTRQNGYLCMMMDGQVLNCSLMYHQSGNTVEILPSLSSGTILSLADLAIFIDSGPLPMPLNAELR